MPPEEIPPVFEWFNDKIVHGAEFFVLFLIGVNAFQRSRVLWIQKWAILNAIFYGLIMGAFTELIQFGAYGRSPDVKDWIADAVGILIAFFFYKSLMKALGWIQNPISGQAGESK